MARESREAPPKRKEPSLIGRLFSSIISLFFWLFISLLISIVIEWIGMTWFWPDESVNHSKSMLKYEQQHLNQQLRLNPAGYIKPIHDTTQHINQWIRKAAKRVHRKSLSLDRNVYLGWLNAYYQKSKVYIEAIPYVAQVFFTRIAIILFSLPAFILSGIYGAADGLIERDLRRWGGGRESSNVYNIARKSIFPVFIFACVLYLSLPISVHPAWVIMPFVVAFGFSVRVSFERLKKYF